jgi:heme-degrading monooxygenase HmoA
VSGDGKTLFSSKGGAMIRVVIERWLAEGGDETIERTMRDLRRKAIHTPGYVTGETLRDIADPHHFLILSTWRSREEWEAWAASETRQEIEDRIRLMLAEPEKITVCESA